MKHVTGLFILLLLLMGNASMSGAQDLAQERETALRYVLEHPALHGDLLDHSQPMQEDFNYSTLLDADTDVLLIGEEHHDNIPQRDVNLMIKQLSGKQGKLTHVASEFLLSSEQPLLDQFMAGKITQEELRAKTRLKDRSFVAAIAKRYHVDIVGLDIPRALEDYTWAVSPEGLTERNEAWTNIILKIKRNNPHAKFLLHAGSNHTQLSSKYTHTLPQLLRQNGLKIKSVEFANPNDPVWKYLASIARYDTLFTIPEKLKPFINADYVVYSVRADFSEQEHKKIAAWTKKHISDSNFDFCLQDPDNPVCRIHIKSARVKKTK